MVSHLLVYSVRSVKAVRVEDVLSDLHQRVAARSSKVLRSNPKAFPREAFACEAIRRIIADCNDGDLIFLFDAIRALPEESMEKAA